MDEFTEMFQVVIQLGAILAVLVLFWSKLWPFSGKKTPTERKNTWSLWLKVVVASVPAALVGILGDKLLEKLTAYFGRILAEEHGVEDRRAQSEYLAAWNDKVKAYYDERNATE